MHETLQAALTDHLTLAQASALLPGRPSAHCLWRWCRRGIVARGGERVCLSHLRIGGRLMTTTTAIAAFGAALATADGAHFANLSDRNAIRSAASRRGALDRARRIRAQQDVRAARLAAIDAAAKERGL